MLCSGGSSDKDHLPDLRRADAESHKQLRDPWSDNGNDIDHVWTQDGQKRRLKPGLDNKKPLSVRPTGFIDENALNV